MVKIRGINIFPQAMGPLLEEVDSFAGEFICKAERDSAGRDEFVVCAEVNGPVTDQEADKYRALLKQKIGIDCGIELSEPGGLADLTQTEVRQKPIRLIDERFK
jgi:phenylacetate-CoA ligase